MFPGVPLFPMKALVFTVLKQGGCGYVVPTGSAPCRGTRGGRYGEFQCLGSLFLLLVDSRGFIS